MWTILLSLLALITAFIHIRAEYLGPDILIYIFKPLTTILIIATALLAQAGKRSSYKRILLIGLLFCLVGDVLLMLPMDLFVPGLLSFLVGHLFYIVAFSSGRKKFEFNWVLPLLVVYAVAVYWLLLPGLGDMSVPVLVYIIIILSMLAQAYSQWRQEKKAWAVFALLGAVLFVLSDTILAINKFAIPFEANRWMSLSTYFSAQWFIAHSISKENKYA